MAEPTFGPMHPITRLERVGQQLRSFAELHANELETVASDLELAGAVELAARLRTYGKLHADEAAMVLEELADVREALRASSPKDGDRGEPEGDTEGDTVVDPAANSPKRARWLAEEARPPAPVSRRTFLTGSKE